MTITTIHSPRPRVEITQELIDRAIPKDSGHCVIADAITAQVPGASSVSVDLQSVRYTDRAAGVRYIWLTPTQAQDLLLAFDYGAPIEPQTIRFGGAAQIVEVKASGRAKAADSATRRQTLEAKAAAGDDLTGSEKRSLATFRAHEARMGGNHVEDRPMSQTSPKAEPVGGASKRVIKVGGKAPGPAVLAHARGRRRQYGMRRAGTPTGVPAVSPTLND